MATMSRSSRRTVTRRCSSVLRRSMSPRPSGKVCVRVPGRTRRITKMWDVQKAAASEAPWTVTEVTLDEDMLVRLCEGDSTGQSFVDLAGNGLLGGGDVAILVERDLLQARSGSRAVQVWTLENVLGSLA